MQRLVVISYQYFGNVGKKLLLDAAQWPRRAQFSLHIITDTPISSC